MVKNTEGLVVASAESGLWVNADKTKYMVMSRDQSAGQRHGLKIDSSSFAKVEQFRYLGKKINESKFYSGRNEKQIEVRECLLLFGAESFVFQMAI